MVVQPDLIRKVERLKGVKAILLYGSFARGEEDFLSDVDIMVIIDNPEIKEYIQNELKELNPTITTMNGIVESIKLHPSTAVMLKEAIPLYGNLPDLPEPRKEDYLRELNEALKILDITEGLLNEIGEDATSTIVYSCILRARQAYIIKCLIRKEKMTKKGFIEELKKIGIKPEYYDYYRLARDDKLNITLPSHRLKRLIRAVRRYVRKVREEVKKY